MMKKKGNISILVLFVLVASSLIGVITMNFVNQMLYSSDTMVSYYESYYLANGGLELSLAEAKSRGIGFEFTIGTGSSIFTDNFSCANCDFTAKMEGLSTILSQEFRKEATGSCISPIVLEQGESLMIPLIKDNFTGTIAGAFGTGTAYDNLSDGLGNITLNLTSGEEMNAPEINIGLIILSGDELFSDGIFVRTGVIGSTLIPEFLSTFQSTMSGVALPGITDYSLIQKFGAPDYPFKNYLILANTNSGAISFCVNSPTPLPTDNFHITSNGTYHGRTIGLELIYKQPIPSFLMNSVLGSITTTEAPSEAIPTSQE